MFWTISYLPVENIIHNETDGEATVKGLHEAAKGAGAVQTLAATIVENLLNQVADQLAALSMPPGMN